MTFFGNIYGQFRIEAQALQNQPESVQNDLQAAARSADWTVDQNDNLLSPIIPLRLPSDQSAADEILAFPWNDQATSALAFRAANAQLLAFDVFAHSPRGAAGDLQLRYSGHLSDEAGRPHYLFPLIPKVLANQVAREIKKELRYVTPDTPAVLATRPIPTGEAVRTLEVRSVYLPRKRLIEKVKEVRLYEHRLTRRSKDVVHEARLLSLFDADAPARNVSVHLLAGRTASDMVAHALSAFRSEFYGETETEPLPVPTRHGRELMLNFRPQEPAPPAPLPVKPPEKKKKPVPPVPAPEPKPQPGTAAPVPADSEDAWEKLTRQVAVSESILRQARSALDRRRPLLLTGAPGTGKTLLARALAELYSGEKNFQLVTADARWTSSDVIGGMRVKAGEGLRYSFSPGVVTQAATRHRESVKRSGKPFALIIDEFNRANQDEAFGRLLTLLDPTYRDVMPLVSTEDGASAPVYLPDDFLLIATMNDADAARLHEIGAALSRRFITLHVGIPDNERAFLTSQFPETLLPVLDELYHFIGEGASEDDTTRLRDALPIGTYFVKEALEMVKSGLSLDESIATLLRPLLGSLNRERLTALHAHAIRCQFSSVARELESSLSQTLF